MRQIEMLESRRMLDITAINDSSSPQDITNVGGTIFFSADDGVHGRELFVSDGSSAGTTLLKDIVPGGVGSEPHDLVSLDGRTVFFLTHNEFQDPQLWKSDGTEGGTQLVSDLRSVAGRVTKFAQMKAGNGKLFIDLTYGPDRNVLLVSDGTAGGPEVLKNFTASSAFALLAPASGLFFFDASDGTHGYELWKTDGTAGGTSMVKDIPSNTGNSAFGGFYGGDVAVFNDELYFGAHSGSKDQLWKSDGTVNGTVMVADQPVNGNFTLSKGALFFVNNNGLWKTDGTTDDTTLVTTKIVTIGNGPVVIGQPMYFVGDDDVHGDELWKTDDTEAGTVLVKDINPGAGSTDIQSLTNFNGVLYFSDGEELWKSDGTEAGTVKVSNFAAGSANITDGSPLVANGDDLYFSASDVAHGQELWKFNDLSSDLALVKDVNATAPDFLTIAHRNGLIYDTIVGTSGDDVVTLAPSGDYFVAALNGKAMVLDPVRAGTGQVVINTLAGNDSIDASAYPFELNINAGDGADSISSGSAGDLIVGGSGNDTISGNDGADRITGDDGKDHLYGNGGNDIIYGGAQSDFIRGNDGHDHLYGNGGNDVIYGGASNDSLYGQGGNDQLFGEGGNDRLYADYATGISTLHGGAGDDEMIATNGRVDQLFGDGGHDSSTADPSDILTSIESPG